MSAPIHPAFRVLATLDALDRTDVTTRLATWIGALCDALPNLNGMQEEATARALGYLGSELAALLIAHQEAAWVKREAQR